MFARDGVGHVAPRAPGLAIVALVGLAGLPATSGCAVFIEAGADRIAQGDDKATGFHVGLGATLTYDQPGRFAVSVAAMRRADQAASLPIKLIQSDGWELRGDKDLRPLRWRATALVRRAGVERTYLAGDAPGPSGGRVWTLGLGVSRYWGNEVGSINVALVPTLQTLDLGDTSGMTYGATVRVTAGLQGLLGALAGCGAECWAAAQASAAASSSGSSSSGSRPSTPQRTSCYYRTRNGRQEWYCP